MFSLVLLVSVGVCRCLQGSPRLSRFSEFLGGSPTSSKNISQISLSFPSSSTVLQGSLRFAQVRQGSRRFEQVREVSPRFAKVRQGSSRFAKFAKFITIRQGSLGFFEVLSGSVRFVMVRHGSPKFAKVRWGSVTFAESRRGSKRSAEAR